MKGFSKVIAVVAVAVMVMSMMPAHAASKSATVQLPVPITGTTLGVNNGSANTDPDNACTPMDAGCQKQSVARVARCAYLADKAAGQTAFQDADSGVFGYVVAISGSPTTFTLKSVPANTADFDVAFYISLGECDNQNVKRSGVIDRKGAPTPYAASGTEPRTSWSHFGNGAESGSIPVGKDADGVTLRTRFAIVTLWGDHDKTFELTVS